MKQKKIVWLIRALFVMPVVSGSAMAQQSPAPAADDVQQIVVTGIRASIRSALASKEASNSMIEVIASEDIGKLPDTTIAETLARLPGLSSGIDRGNASQVVARGLGPRFIGATLNGRELASSEPARAVRFEQFPSESISGATVAKTQSAELIEGGAATSIDLQTVKPLSFKSRQISLKADALYYPLGDKLPGASSTAPRVGGVYIDQFNNNTLGVALAFSYQKQPSLQKNSKLWGFNEDHSTDLNGDGKIDKTPWGFQDDIKRGKDARSSFLGKTEWKASPDALLTADIYYAKAGIKEPELQHYTGDLGNWDGYEKANYSKLDIRNGYVVGATVTNVGIVNNDALWTQDTHNLAGGLNGKFNVDAWKIEADLSTSVASRDSQWRDVKQYSKANGTITWSFTGDENQSYSFSHDSGNPAAFWQPTLDVNTDGHLKDTLNGFHLNGSRSVGFGDISKVKFGVRLTERKKDYSQTTWSLNPTGTVPDSAYETIRVDGFAPYIALKDFNSTVATYFGAKAFDPNGRLQTRDDLLAGWKVTESSSSMYAQADLDGNMMGHSYRGNAGIRVVHTKQTGGGMQSLNGAAPKDFVDGISYTEVLPSVNLVFNLDAKQEKQIRFGASRAMSRAPLDEMRGSRNLNVDVNPVMPVTGSAGNPHLKPMLADQVDLAYQWYFGKGSLLSGGLFYKKISDYIGITADKSEVIVNGVSRTATVTHSINGTGGNVRGLELIYQQAFTGLPAPFDGLGVYSNYSYTQSSIHENIPTSSPYPVEGLMKNNGGITLWYEKAGYEARMSVNYHSPFVRNPTWGAGQLTVNGAETYMTLNLSKKITNQVQVRFGIDNLTNQKVVYTSTNNPYSQEVTEFGRRFNLGVSYKM